MSDELNMTSVLKGLLVVTVLGVLVGWWAFRGHVRRAMLVEGRVRARTLAEGIARCASSSSSLPASAGPVSASLASVAARRASTTAADWAAPAFSCAGYAPEEPQLYRVRWERTDERTGHVEADADLDGDSARDAWVRVEVSCAPASSCQVGRLQLSP